MKTRIMRKLLFGNLVIFSLLLLLQLAFQTMFFEPFLTHEQSKKLMRNMDSIQVALKTDDENTVRHRINDGLSQGMVIIAVDQDMKQTFGQNFEQYQSCFTIEAESGKQFNIVEDYLESVPLQTIDVGDTVSIDGYLVDAHNALVIPSKVYRPSDGVVLGTDTFLFINHKDETRSDELPDSTAIEKSNLAPSNIGISIADGAPISSKGESMVNSDNTTVGQGFVMGDKSDPTLQPVQVTPTSTVFASDTQVADSEQSVTQPEFSQQDESSYPQGFVLQSPYDVSADKESLALRESLTGVLQNSTLRAERMLIIDGDNLDSHSYPISIKGRVILKADVSNTNLTVQQGLINDEIKRLSAKTNLSESIGTYTVTSQLTTGQYLLCVSHLAQSHTTLIGAISLYAIKDMNRLINTFHFILFLVELGLLAGAIYIFSRMISKPLVAMNGVALKIAQQDFSSRITVTSQDEVGTLGVAINTIATNLEQKIQQINTINDHLQLDYEKQVALQQRHKQLSASFSHELKTPLTIVRGYIDSIQNGIYSKDSGEYYEIALRELDNASNLITQMLEIAKMESPYFTLKKNVIDLWMVFFKVYDELKQTIDQRRMQVLFSSEDEAYTIADAELMERVITNVLTNAMKYSPEGSSITVRISTTEAQHTFCMENDHCYIPTEDLEKIWQPFYRGKKSQTGDVSGTGLGLLIVSDILNSHGFTYCIRNTDHGVAFSFSCPSAPLAIEQSDTL